MSDYAIRVKKAKNRFLTIGLLLVLWSAWCVQFEFNRPLIIGQVHDCWTFRPNDGGDNYLCGFTTEEGYETLGISRRDWKDLKALEGNGQVTTFQPKPRSGNILFAVIGVLIGTLSLYVGSRKWLNPDWVKIVVWR